MLKHAATTLRTCTQRGMAGEIYRFVRLFIPLTEIKFQLAIVIQLEDRGKRPTHLADKALHRTNMTIRQKLFDL